MYERLKPGVTANHRDPTFTPSDLPIGEQGWIYHLQIKPEQIAPDILIVGDPARAAMIGRTFFRDIEFEHEHRGLLTITGKVPLTGNKSTLISPLKATVTTSGMGTPSLEIVLQELVALNEIDFKTRSYRQDFPRLHIIRVGTAGGLQASTRLGTPIITTYAVGMDNTGMFYETSHQDDVCARLEQELDQLIEQSMSKESRFFGKIHPYVSRAEPHVVEALSQAAAELGVSCKLGLTVSNSGFFAPQARDVTRIKPSIPGWDKILADFDPGLNGQRIENLEMETSFLTHFLGGLGHWGGTICTAIANRRENTFDHHVQETVQNSIRVALLALAKLRT